MDLVPAIASMPQDLLSLLGTVVLYVVLAGVGGFCLAFSGATVWAIPKQAREFEPEHRGLIALIAPIYLMFALFSLMAGLAAIGALLLQLLGHLGAATFADAAENWLSSPSANVVEGRAFIFVFGLLMVAFALGVAVVCLAAVPRVGRHIEGFGDVVRLVSSGLFGLVFLLVAATLLQELLTAIF